MKTFLQTFVVLAFISVSHCAWSQDQWSQDHQISSIFGGNRARSSGGYGAINSKFTTIDGHFAYLNGIYGGWYVNHKFTLGLSASSLINNIPVPAEHRVHPQEKLSYQYTQFGLFTEYVIASHKTIHLAFQLFAGPGFTNQYERFDFEAERDELLDMKWFTVVEPGVNVEVNLLRWMRLSTGVSYRNAFGTAGRGLEIKDLSDVSYNVGLKFGKF